MIPLTIIKFPGLVVISKKSTESLMVKAIYKVSRTTYSEFSEMHCGQTTPKLTLLEVRVGWR